MRFALETLDECSDDAVLADIVRGQMIAAYSTSSRYGTIEQVLHWATAILVVAAFLYGPGGSEQRVYAAANDFDRQIHETLGISVLAVTLVRLAWRIFDATPENPPMPSWMRWSSKIVHVTLYLLLLAVPLTAISGAWLEGHSITLLANVSIEPLLADAHDLGRQIAYVHTWLGDAILWVAGLHASAALFHHFVLRDRVLRSMLPY